MVMELNALHMHVFESKRNMRNKNLKRGAKSRCSIRNISYETYRAN